MTTRATGARLPWRLKIVLKLLLARMPVPRRVWNRAKVFRHGHMRDPSYALGVFDRHFGRVDFPAKSGEFVCLELGPGDSLLSAVVARGRGASHTYLVDVASFADVDVRFYAQAAAQLRLAGLAAPEIDPTASVPDMLNRLSADYLIDGLASLRTLPSASVDFVWSQSVLQHIRKAEFQATMAEVHRLLRPGGVCSHSVDLKDCIGGALNNLRFSEGFWENDFVAGSGFYTNRIRFTEMQDIWRSVGFVPEVISTSNWGSMATPRSRLAPGFRQLTEDELLVSAFEVILRAA